MITKLFKTAFTLSVLLILLSAGNSFGQNDDRSKKSPDEIARKITDKMKTRLSLTDEQYKQVYDLNLRKINTRINNKENYKNLDKESRKDLKKQNREEYNKSLESILTTDQMNTYRKYISEKQNSKKNKKNKNKSLND